MDKHEYDLIASAYVNLLRVPLNSPRRHALQGALATLRDELAAIEAKGAEEIQVTFEQVADALEKQEEA